MKQTRSIFLLIMAIVCVVLGGVALIPLLLGLPLYGTVIQMLGTSYLLSLIASFAVAGLLVVAGILGIANHKNPIRARICVPIGFILVALRIAIIVMEKVLAKANPDIVSGATASSIVLSVVGVAICVLYTVAAMQFARNG